jgi:hypothetical protein
MQKLTHKVAQVANPFKKHREEANNDSISFE